MKLTRKQKVSYGTGAIGKDMVYAFVSGFLLYYFNVVLGISGAFVGVLFMVARIFDAFNDPLMGVIVEKTKTRWGKFRPWLLLGTLSNAGVLYAMFSVPKGLTGAPLLVYISVAYILWGVTYTIMDIPYWSMIPAITEPGKERENISVIARSCAGVGFALPTALTIKLVSILGNGNDRIGFQYMALGIAVIFILAISVTVANISEHKEAKIEKAQSVKDMLMSLVRNDQAIVVVIGIIVFNASLYLTQTLALYFFKYDIGNEELFGVFGTVGGAAQIISMMMLPVLRKKMECKKILILAIGITLSGYAFLFTLGSLKITNLILLCIAAIIIFIGFGLATVLTTIFLADSIDYGEWKNHQRNESVVFALQTFVVKLASAISGLLGGVAIDLIGIKEEAAKQSQSTLTGLRFFMIIIPMIGLIASIIYFYKKYRLDEKTLSSIAADLQKRKAG